MVLPNNINDLELKKFVEDGSGNVALRTAITVEDIEIGAVELKNATTDDRAIIDSAGDLHSKAKISDGSVTATISTISPTVKGLDVNIVGGDIEVSVVGLKDSSDVRINPAKEDGNLATIAGDTTSVDSKITACNTGAVVVSSGSITETNSGTISSDTTSIDSKITACNTGAVVVSSGAITETNSGTISSDTTSIDSKITACNTGAVVVSSGSIDVGTITTVPPATFATDSIDVSGSDVTVSSLPNVTLTNTCDTSSVTITTQPALTFANDAVDVSGSDVTGTVTVSNIDTCDTTDVTITSAPASAYSTDTIQVYGSDTTLPILTDVNGRLSVDINSEPALTFATDTVDISGSDVTVSSTPVADYTTDSILVHIDGTDNVISGTVTAIPSDGTTSIKLATTVSTANGASGLTIVPATVDKKSRIFLVTITSDTAGLVTLSDGIGAHYIGANGSFTMDFQHLGKLQGSANTVITATNAGGGNIGANVTYSVE